MKKYFIAGSIVLVIFLIYSLVKNKEQKMEVPKILNTKKCFWVGGKDGGYWVEVLYFNNRDSIIAKLYTEGIGSCFEKNVYVSPDSNLIKNDKPIDLVNSSNAVSQRQFQIKFGNKYYTYMNIIQD